MHYRDHEVVVRINRQNPDIAGGVHDCNVDLDASTDAACLETAGAGTFEPSAEQEWGRDPGTLALLTASQRSVYRKQTGRVIIVIASRQPEPGDDRTRAAG